MGMVIKGARSRPERRARNRKEAVKRDETGLASLRGFVAAGRPAGICHLESFSHRFFVASGKAWSHTELEGAVYRLRDDRSMLYCEGELSLWLRGRSHGRTS